MTAVGAPGGPRTRPQADPKGSVANALERENRKLR